MFGDLYIVSPQSILDKVNPAQLHVAQHMTTHRLIRQRCTTKNDVLSRRQNGVVITRTGEITTTGSTWLTYMIHHLSRWDAPSSHHCFFMALNWKSLESLGLQLRARCYPSISVTRVAEIGPQGYHSALQKPKTPGIKWFSVEKKCKTNTNILGSHGPSSAVAPELLWIRTSSLIGWAMASCQEP